jgi:hypothetical protein
MNFDDFLKNSFEKEPFEFNEEYWIQAQVLLDKEKRKRRIRRLAILGSLLFFLLTLIGLFLRNQRGVSQNSLPKEPRVEFAVVEEAMPDLEANQSVEAVEKGKVSNAMGRDAQSESKEVLNTKVDSKEVEAVKAESSAPIDVTAEILQAGSESALAESEAFAEAQIESDEIEAVMAESSAPIDVKAEILQAGSESALAESEAFAEAQIESDEIEAVMAESSAPIDVKAEILQAEGAGSESALAESEAFPEAQIESDEIEAVMAESNEEAPMGLGSTPRVKADYFLLPLLDNSWVLSLQEGVDNQPLASIGRIPSRPGKWSVGFDVMNLPSLGQGEGTFNELGFSLLRWIPLKGKLFLETGMGLRGRTGDFAPSVTTFQTSYGFGYIEDRFTLRPQVFYTAHLPFLLGYSKDRYQFTAGILCSGLLGAWGVNELQTYNAQEPGVRPATEILQQGWLDTQGFRSLNISYLLGYKVYVLPSIQFGLFAEFRNRDWIAQGYGRQLSTQNVEGVVPDPTALPSYRNVSLGASLRYFFTLKPRL